MACIHNSVDHATRWVLNKNNGSFLKGITKEERRALHECIAWSRQKGTNPIFRIWGPELEAFDNACQTLMARFRSELALPEGSLKARRAHNSDLGREVEWVYF